MKITLTKKELLYIKNIISHYTLNVDVSDVVFQDWEKGDHWCKFGKFHISKNDSIDIDIPSEVIIDIVRSIDRDIRFKFTEVKASFMEVFNKFRDTILSAGNNMIECIDRYKSVYEYNVFISEDLFGKDVVYIIRLDVDRLQRPKIMKYQLMSGDSWDSDRYPEKYNETAVILGSFTDIEHASEFMDKVISLRQEWNEDGMRVWNVNKIRSKFFESCSMHPKRLAIKEKETQNDLMQ